ncbi:MAG: hypothetical protein U5K74_02840 [Gemmatimonadaceae bacterium]|nr:hypothetical protein [Gemmatimonadaceae bacterium]
MTVPSVISTSSADGGRSQASRMEAICVRQITLLKVASRKIDGDAHLRVQARSPEARLRTRRSQHPVADREDQTRFLSERNELEG